MRDITIAKTILQQLGGDRFIAMTGASAPLAGSDYLTFKLPPNNSGGDLMKITLTPMDTYTIRVYKTNIRARKAEDMCRELEQHRTEDVYCDNLQEVFTRITGLYTKL